MNRTDFYEKSSFACRNCHRGCCTNFEVSLTAEEQQAIMRLNLPGTVSWNECFNVQPDGRIVVAKRAKDGRCVFLSAENRCVIHANYGYAAKPLSCRVFPLHIQHWPDGGYSAEYRFICPGVGGRGDAGKLGNRRRELDALAAEMLQRRPAAPVIYSAANPLGIERIRAVHEAMRRIMHDERRSWRMRLYCCCRILDFHAKRSMHRAVAEADASFAADAAAFVDKASDALLKELSDGTLSPLTKTNFRNIFCGFLRNDDPHKKIGLRQRLQMAWLHFRIVIGAESLRKLNANAPEFKSSCLPELGEFKDMTPEAEDMFREFFFGKLDSMQFCGAMIHNYSYEQGFQLLLCATAAVFAAAYGYAAAENCDCIGAHHMRQAAELIDFTFGRSPFFRMRTVKKWLKQLTGPAAYAGLLNATVRY